MKVDNIIRVWKSEELLASLDSSDRALLPEHPAGSPAELSPEELARVGGDGLWTIITTSSWVCGVTVTVTVCDEIQEYLNELEPEGSWDGGPWGGEGKGCCFAAGTQVRTPNGSQPIETFNAGDQVLGFDFERGVPREGRVQGLDVHGGGWSVMDMDDGDQCLQVTTGHRFHSGEGWQSIERLSGKQCLDSRERRRSVRFRNLGSRSSVYNLRVEGLGSYFVGQSELLVRDW